MNFMKLLHNNGKKVPLFNLQKKEKLIEVSVVSQKDISKRYVTMETVAFGDFVRTGNGTENRHNILFTN